MKSINVLLDGRAEPGIIIFNLKGQMTFVNQIAWNVCKNNTTQRFTIPAQVRRACDELKSRLTRFAWNSCPDAVYLKKIISIGENLFTLRGFNISSPDNYQSTHFLILLEKVAIRSPLSLEQAQSHFKLTSREFELVQFLVQGLPNKEIANKLGIAESTVKEYLRNVMAKVGATSRTRAEVVSKVLSISSTDNLDFALEEQPIHREPLQQRKMSRITQTGKPPQIKSGG